MDEDLPTKQSNRDIDDESGSIQFQFVFIYNIYKGFIVQNSNKLIATSLSVFLFLLGIIIGLIVVIFQNIKTTEQKVQIIVQSGFKKTLGVLLVVFSKVLYIPFIDISLRNATDTFNDMTVSLNIVFFIVNVISLFFYVIAVFYTKLVFKMSIVPGTDDKVPWNRPNSSMVYFEFLAKILNTCLFAIDQNGKFVEIEIIVSFIVQVLYITMAIYFVEVFHKNIRMAQKIMQSIVCLILEISVIKYVLRINDHKDGILFLTLVGFQIGFVYLIQSVRSKRLMRQFKEGHLKIEMDLENLLIDLINLSQNALLEIGTNHIHYFSQILHMISQHTLICKDADCFCHYMDQFINIFREHHRQGKSLIKVKASESKKIKAFIQQSDIRGFITKISRMREDFQQAGSHNDIHRQDRDQRENCHREDNHSGDESTELKSSNQKIYEIDIELVKQRLITQFIMIYFNEIKQKNPNSIKIYNLYNYYTMFILQRPQLCIYQLRSNEFRNLSWIENLSNQINEFYLLFKFEQFETSKLRQDQINFDGEHFIQINTLYSAFHLRIESLSLNAIDFWKGFASEEINPYQQYEIGSKIAEDINDLYQKFTKIEKNLLQKDYKIYLWFAIIQQKIMNDQDGHTIFMGKMKEVLNMNKIFKNNIKISTNKAWFNDNEDSGFLVVDGRQQQQGQILFMNKQLKRWLENNESKFQNINTMMPKMIADSHDKFLQKYNQSGKSVMFNKKILHFLKTRNNSIFPADIVVKFHYSQKYNYCFVGLINRIKIANPFRDGLKYPVDQLVFLSIDWENGQINEASENFIELLQVYGIFSRVNIRQVSFSEKAICLDKIFQHFSFSDVKANREAQESRMTNMYEGIHQLNLSDFNDELDNRSFIMNQTSKCNVKVGIFQESYSQGLCEMGFACLFLMQDELNQEFQNMHKQPDKTFGVEEQMIEMEEQQNYMNDDSGSQASSSMGSSASSGTTFQTMQQFHSFYRQQTPKILKIVIQMIAIMFIISISIATLNLGISINNQIQTSFNIQTVKAAYDRINYTVTNRLILRVLLNIANGYESNTSQLIEDRWTEYKLQQTTKVTQLKDTQYFLDNSGYKFSDEFNKIRYSDNINLLYIKENGKIFTEKVPMRIAQNLFQSRLMQINTYRKDQLKGNLYVQTLTPNNSKDYNPTTEEEIIYFTVINGNGIIRQFNWFFKDLYLADTTDYSTESLKQTEITTILSIVTIVVVALIVSPIISKTEERKFNALSFFLKISKQEVLHNIKKCEECLKLEEDQNIYHMNESDQKAVEKEKSQRGEEKNIYIDFIEESVYFDQSSRFNVDDFNTNNNKTFNRSSQFNTNRSIQSNRFLMQSSAQNMSGLNLSVFGQKINEKPDKAQNKDEASPKNDIQISKPKKNMQNLKSLENIQNKTVTHHEDSISVADIELEEKTAETLQTHQKLINKIGLRNKIKSFLVIISLALAFSIYFVATFLMSKSNYQQADQSIIDLGVIFNKDSCFENMIIFIRENQIRNQSVVLTESPNTVASQSLLKTCLSREKDYTALRRNIPPYFEDSQEYLNGLETDRFCDMIYTSREEQKNLLMCKSAINGILNKGLSASLSYMYSHSQKLQLDFDTSLSLKYRDLPFLTRSLSNKETIELIDMKTYILNPALEELKQNCMASTLTHFQKLRNQIIIVYAIFIVLIISAVIYFTMYAFKKLRKTMWNTNLLLKIIPIAGMDKKDQEKIKNFFVN